MSPTRRRPDPIEDYVTTLAAALHGPARAKTRMIEEIRDGLTDAVAARTGEGVPYHRAALEAVWEFGTAEELVPSCQLELTIGQTRHTARALALTGLFLSACWLLVWTAGHGKSWHLPLIAGAAAVTGLLAAATLAATGTLARRLPIPPRLPLAVAWAGTATAVTMALATLALAVAAALTAEWPLMALAGVLTAASHGVVANSARACRRCARLPIACTVASSPPG
jgi:hypothetical protein